MTSTDRLTRQAIRGDVGPLALLTAVGFVVLYAAAVAVTMTASSELPLPDDPTDRVRAWFSENPTTAVLMGVCQALSVSFLAGFAVVLRIPRATRWGLLAAALMLVSSCCAWLLAALAADASLGTVELLREVSFLAGGAAHVLALGLFVHVAARAGGFGGRLRALAAVALAVAVLSLSSLLVFQGSAFILLGRVLCMAWTVVAAVSIVRRRSAS